MIMRPISSLDCIYWNGCRYVMLISSSKPQVLWFQPGHLWRFICLFFVELKQSKALQESYLLEKGTTCPIWATCSGRFGKVGLPQLRDLGLAQLSSGIQAAIRTCSTPLQDMNGYSTRAHSITLLYISSSLSSLLLGMAVLRRLRSLDLLER